MSDSDTHSDAHANLAVSVRMRLVKIAHERGEESGMLFTRYALERFLYRLGQSGQRPNFVLKGAMLLHALDPGFRRATKDLDLLGFGSSDPEHLAACFRECAAFPVEDDGLDFDTSELTCVPIREELEYGGQRVSFTARLGKAVLPIQIDVGFGDAITPGPEDLLYPTLLKQAQPNIRAYPVVTSVAEKLHAIGLDRLLSTMRTDSNQEFDHAKKTAKNVHQRIQNPSHSTRQTTRQHHQSNRSSETISSIGSREAMGSFTTRRFGVGGTCEIRDEQGRVGGSGDSRGRKSGLEELM